MFESPTSDSSYFLPNPRVLPNGLLEERVRVDRKLYEKLIYYEDFATHEDFSNDPTLVSAEEFFGNIMTATNTHISWPSRVRLNSRSRKDPHIKIVGSEEALNEAKVHIFSLLDTRKNRVTLKMDISFTDHSHVIGKGGRSIQKVMDDTGCHIHFPDSNRTNAFEKSNQVSITGTAAGTEHARCRIRELLPIAVSYEIPMTTFVRNAMDPASMTCQNLQRNFGINVTFKIIPLLRSNYGMTDHTLVQVHIRGSRSMIASVRQGIAVLLEQLTGGIFTLASTAAIIDIEIAAQHHSFVMGRIAQNVRMIQQKTGCLITFPEPSPPIMGITGPSASTVPNKKSTVTIRGGNFDAAHQAWQELLQHLPLVLIFDLPEGVESDGQLITRLMDELKVSILVKPRQKANNKSLMVRCAEKDSRVLFEVRRQILGLDMSEVPYCCEQHYWNRLPSPTQSTLGMGAFSLPPSSPSNLSVASATTSGIWANEPRGHPNDYWNSSRTRALEGAIAPHSIVKPTSGLFGTMAGTSLAQFMANHGSDSLGNSRKTTASDVTPNMASSNSALDENRIDDLFSSELDQSVEMKLRAFKKIQSRPFDSSSQLTLDEQFSRLNLSKTMPDTVRNLRSVQSADCLASMDTTRRQLDLLTTDSGRWTSTDGFQEQPFSSSSYFPSMLPNMTSVFNGKPSPEEVFKADLADILSHFGLAKYLDNFENVDLRQFLFMTPQDLQIRGIPFNARETIMTLMKHLRQTFFSENSLLRKATSTSNFTSLEQPASGYQFSLLRGHDSMVTSSSTNLSSSSSQECSSTSSTASCSSSRTLRSCGSNTPSVSDDVFSTFFGSRFEAAPGAERQVPQTPFQSPQD